MPIDMFTHILREEPEPQICRRYTPRPELRPVIREVVEYTAAHGIHEPAFADGEPCLVFVQDAPAGIRVVVDGREQIRRAAYLAAPVLENTSIHTQGTARLLVVRFAPQGLHAVTDRPMDILRSRPSRSLEELWGYEAHSLVEQVRRGTSVCESIAAVENFFERRMRFRDTPLFREAVDRIRSDRGTTTIRDLCASLRVNAKWLERQFRAYLGIAPKEYARVQRFLHAFLDARRTGGRDLMGTAVRHGYCDLTHFTRECRRLTGRPPGALARRL